ncbi:hypothetical protein IGS68_01100 [Skermanella sp. TT6]|uniref:Uncharacterized protein n=1 Tax=Skermanella cutis TaxID=2775420 RepID=A0ABX7B6W7_9PROT|nr:hypothetical protein [Skermanella sp. TT6]QQP89907.1 hypothetical protein IGS68_01100 [Skermanella sp. TT6]
MLISTLTPKAILIVFIFGILLLVDRGCSQIDRHDAAMKDLGENDYVPVRSPWAIEGEGQK